MLKERELTTNEWLPYYYLDSFVLSGTGIVKLRTGGDAE